MSWRGVTRHTRAASAAESRRRATTSPSLATRTCASASRPSVSATGLTFSPARWAARRERGIDAVKMSTDPTDGRKAYGSGPAGARPRAARHRRRHQRLAVGDLHRRPVAADRALPVEVGPEPAHLDGDRLRRVVLG